MQATAQELVTAMTSSRYVLSGDWVQEGEKTADVATLYEHFFTPALLARIKAAKTLDQIEPKVGLLVLGLGTDAGTHGLKASTACKEAKTETCQVWALEGTGAGQSASPAGNGIDLSTVSISGNEVKFTVNVFTPAATPAGVDSYADVNVNVDVVLAPNPNAGMPGELPYLIDNVNNTETISGLHPLTDTIKIS
jgi:hypothetical protein